MSTLQQLIDVLLIDVQPLTLHIWTIITAIMYRSLVRRHSTPLEILAELLGGAFNQSRLICVLDA